VFQKTKGDGQMFKITAMLSTYATVHTSVSG